MSQWFSAPIFISHVSILTLFIRTAQNIIQNGSKGARLTLYKCFRTCQCRQVSGGTSFFVKLVHIDTYRTVPKISWHMCIRRGVILYKIVSATCPCFHDLHYTNVSVTLFKRYKFSFDTCPNRNMKYCTKYCVDK